MIFSKQTLESLVYRWLPETDGEISFSPIPTGKFNTSYYVRAGEQELVLRIAPPADAVFVFYERDMMHQEPPLHQMLLERTNVPVAPVVGYDDSHKLIDRDYMLVQRLPGKPLSEMPQADEADVLRQVGQHLAEVHHIRAEQFGYLGEHHPMPAQSCWLDAFVLMWANLLDDIVAVGHYAKEEANSLTHLLERSLSCFEHQPPACLLHMDIWSQNILVESTSRVTGILDWDRALWGNPEIEFAVLDYCSISKPAFWEGYGQTRDISSQAQIRQVFYLLYELQKYIVIYQGRLNDYQRATRYKKQVMQIIRQHLPSG